MKQPGSPPTQRTVHRLGPGGTILDWVVSGVARWPAEDLADQVAPDGSPWQTADGRFPRWVLTNGPDVQQLKESLLRKRRPPERLDVGAVRVGGVVAGEDWAPDAAAASGRWQRRHLLPDGLVDGSTFCFTPQYRLFYAATVVEVDQSEWRTLRVDSTGPYRLWVGGTLVATSDRVSYMHPVSQSHQLRLPSGSTEVVLATWQVAFREVRHVIRARVEGLPVRVVLPEEGADEHVAATAEQVLESVGSTSWALRGPGHDTVSLVGPPHTRLLVRAHDGPWRSVSLDEAGTANLRLDEEAGGAPVASASMLGTGETRLSVCLDHPQAPAQRWMRVSSLPTDTRSEPRGDPRQWQQEVLEHVAGQDSNVATALALTAVDEGARVEPEHLRAALDRIGTRGDCADFEIVGLMVLWHQVPQGRWAPGLRMQVQQALTSMKYWIDQPGLDAMCYFTENHQLVWHVAQRLAGSTFADLTFTVDGRSGAQHAEEGSDRARAWIQRKLAGGFSEFDSNAYLAIDTLALAALVELEPEEELRGAAEALLDLLLLTLCSNAWRGIHGAAHGRSYVPTLRSARTEETSPILRLVAGVGTLNTAVLPVTALATSRRYRIPSILRRIVGQPSAQWWGRQVYRGELVFERDLLSRPYGSDLRVYRTPNVCLSSVQDYRSGLPGLQEHVGGATLGPELQVFVTLPANEDTGSAARPNAWAGQLVLPRVRQHRTVMLTLYDPPEGTSVARPHLWLPEEQCDEVLRLGDWLAGRRGSGYVAVATPGGLRPVLTGECAWQEHRPIADGLGWVTVVADAGTAGDFAGWVESLAPPLTADGGVRWCSPDGTAYDLPARGAFLVGGQAVDLVDGALPAPPRLDNPAVRASYDEDIVHARWGGSELVLDLAQGRRLTADVDDLAMSVGGRSRDGR